MVLEMKQFGTVLSMRISGRRAFEMVDPLLRSGNKVVFDFDGVDSVTNSFADELFGRLAFELGMPTLKELTSFVHINQIAAISVRRAMEHRAALVAS